MSKKKTRKTKTFPWRQIGIFAGLLIMINVVFVLLLVKTDDENKINDNPAVESDQPYGQTAIEEADKMQPIDLGQNIVITDIGTYTGIYMEDGTDEVVSDVLMAVVKNNGDQTLQYSEIRMKYGETEALFSLSTLPPGGSAVVLEQNKMPPQDGQPDSVWMESTVFFREDVSMHEDMFEVTAMDGMMNVKNISGRDITGDIFIYYKNSSPDLYYGGITYRARVENGLADGELKQIVAAHYSAKGSSLMMVTYSE